MPRYRRVLRRPESTVSDLRSAAPSKGGVSVEPASSTTADEPQLTDSDVAPEASPAKTKSTGSKKPRTRRKKS